MATSRISVDSNGNEGNNSALNPVISADGRYVAFDSDATNLIINDTNDDIDDIFIRDLQANTTSLISLNSNGTQGNNASLDPSVSSDGRYVAFQSLASNLAIGDTNATSDIFVRDLQTNTTQRISVDANGTQADNYSNNPSISANGRFVAFYSEASNLVPDDTNDRPDIFVRDLQANTTQRVSVDSNGIQGNDGSFQQPEISADGRYVTFESDATNLVPNDTNDARDIFVRDLQTNTTRRVSVDSNGIQGNSGSFFPVISADGRYVTFESDATNLVADDTNNGISGDINDIFVYDLQANTTSLVSVSSDGTQGNSNSFSASISADGRYVAFVSTASNLVPDDLNKAGDVFLRDLQTNTTRLISVSSDDAQGDGGSSVDPAISADGRFIAFNSFASNLVPDDTNESRDIFVTDAGESPTSNFSNLDVDGSGGAPNFARDGLLISAFLFYYRSERTDYSILDRFILDDNATRKTGNEIADYLKSDLDALDVDGSGSEPNFARDGLLISAFLFYYRSEKTDYSILDRFILDDSATRKTGNEIADYLKNFLDVSSALAAVDSETIVPSEDSEDILGMGENDILVGDFRNDLLASDLGVNSFVFEANSDLGSIFSSNMEDNSSPVSEDLSQIDRHLGFVDSEIAFDAIASQKISYDRFAFELFLEFDSID
jgi:hypothetical protein